MVKINYIASQKLLHAFEGRLPSGPDQQVIKHQRPGVNNQITFSAQVTQPVEEILPIGSGSEYVYPFDPPAHYMM